MGRLAIPPTAIKRPPNECLCTAVERMLVVRRERETVRSRWLSDVLARVARDNPAVDARRASHAIGCPRRCLPTWQQRRSSLRLAALHCHLNSQSVTKKIALLLKRFTKKKRFFPFVSFVIGPLLSKRCSGPSLVKAFALHGICDDVGGDALREAKEKQNTRAQKMHEQKRKLRSIYRAQYAAGLTSARLAAVCTHKLVWAMSETGRCGVTTWVSIRYSTVLHVRWMPRNAAL